jgi:hypothetical protein
MNIDTFCNSYPQYCIDFSRPLKDQPRVYAVDVLPSLPYELEPWANRPEYKGRGAVNVNQTKTHYQCVSCDRILRNDAFHLPPSFIARNRVFSYCKNCYVALNADAYDARAEIVEVRRQAIWAYLAPYCAHCGFNAHSSAMDMHHAEGDKESPVSDLITRVTLAPTAHNVGQLLREASKCIPLCANCHRMLHAGVLTLQADGRPLRYTLAGLTDVLKGTG